MGPGHISAGRGRDVALRRWAKRQNGGKVRGHLPCVSEPFTELIAIGEPRCGCQRHRHSDATKNLQLQPIALGPKPIAAAVLNERERLDAPAAPRRTLSIHAIRAVDAPPTGASDKKYKEDETVENCRIPSIKLRKEVFGGMCDEISHRHVSC
jgi:hypothetical protein